MAAAISLNACAMGGKKKPPTWNGKIYTGDPTAMALVRKQEPNDIISCGSIEFNKVKCFTDDDFKSWVKTYVKGCKIWK